MTPAAPIGIFDSGIGGLTVVAALRRTLPLEALHYLGDTARLPYGTKSPDVVRRYALACARFLAGEGAKMVVVACNTATAHGLPAIRAELGLAVIGVIEPGAKLAAERSRSGRIGVIGTEGTIHSGSYQAAIARLRPEAQVFAQACPLFVPLAEEGMGAHAATRLLAAEYLAPLQRADIDTLILGCTHYPLLKTVIQEIVGPGVDVIDSATAVAQTVHDELQASMLLTAARAEPDRFFATDAGPRFSRVGRAFLGADIADVGLVDL